MSVFSFRLRAYQFNDSAVFLNINTDMEVSVDSDRQLVAFRVTSPPRPIPAENPAGGWFILDKDVSLIWMDRLTKINISAWKDDYNQRPIRSDIVHYGLTIYGDEDITTDISLPLPPQWEEFIRLVDTLYPIHNDRDFIWPGGILYPDEEERKRQEMIRARYDEWNRELTEDDFLTFEEMEDCLIYADEIDEFDE